MQGITEHSSLHAQLLSISAVFSYRLPSQHDAYTPPVLSPLIHPMPELHCHIINPPKRSCIIQTGIKAELSIDSQAVFPLLHLLSKSFIK